MNSPTTFRAAWPEALALLCWLGACFAVMGIGVWHDITWQLWIARHLNAGVGLYSWIMEVNPPLWFWMAQPIDLLANATGLPALRLLLAAILLLIGLSLVLAARLSRDYPPRLRAVLYCGMLLATVLITIGDFAQREHLTLIAAIPYALLIARRAAGQHVSWQLVLATALLATPMFALKHYFALIPILLECWLIWRLRRQWRPLRIETITLALGALAYAAAILIFTPEYLADMVPGLRLAYGDLRMSVRVFLLNPMTLLLAASLFYFWHFRRELQPVAQAMLLIAGAFLIAYILQAKGWTYQFTPIMAALFLAQLLHLAQRPALSVMRRAERATAILMAGLALWSPLALGPYRNEFTPIYDRLLDETRPGMTAVMLTTKASRMWPMVDDTGLKWPSRYYHFWMMQAAANRLAAGQQLDGDLGNYLAQIRLDTVEDFTCNPPDFLIDDGASVDNVDFDMLAFFRAEPRFAALMEAYAVDQRLGPFTVYRRIASLPAPAGPCTTLLTVH
jgi:hypothetical protein